MHVACPLAASMLVCCALLVTLLCTPTTPALYPSPYGVRRRSRAGGRSTPSTGRPPFGCLAVRQNLSLRVALAHARASPSRLALTQTFPLGLSPALNLPRRRASPCPPTCARYSSWSPSPRRSVSANLPTLRSSGVRLPTSADHHRWGTPSYALNSRPSPDLGSIRRCWPPPS